MDRALITQLFLGLLGGLALFIYGMRVMSDGLAAALGEKIRGIINKATRNKASGVALGGTIGFLIQSSASIVLFIGFINAGLMTFSQSIVPMLGVNIGTTLSIQLISFKLSDYALGAVFIGLLFHLISKRSTLKNIGLALLGFGLLFLGMTLMSDAIRPHRAFFSPWLAQINGNTITGLLVGTLLAALITGIIQSSGAVIGMGFAMISAGAITDLSGIYPIIIGANIGTCVTGLIGSIGTSIEARRCALSHLFFNLFSTLLALFAAPLFYRYIPHTSTDLIHQAANANTIKMIFSVFVLLPFISFLKRFIQYITPSKAPKTEPSFLDEALLDRPELAIFSCLKELQRTTRICAQSLRISAKEFIQHNPNWVKQISTNEQSVNSIKLAMHDYVLKVSHQNVSKRQAILLGHIDRCMSDLERVGDHIENLASIAMRQRKIPDATFGKELVDDWLFIHERVEKLVEKVIESLDPELEHFQEIAKEILLLREQYQKAAIRIRNTHYRRIEEQSISPIAGVLFGEYLSNFWRITKHIKNIALAEQEPQFWLKQEKLNHVISSDHPTPYPSSNPINPKDYLDRLQSDNYN